MLKKALSRTYKSTPLSSVDESMCDNPKSIRIRLEFFNEMQSLQFFKSGLFGTNNILDVVKSPWITFIACNLATNIPISLPKNDED